MNARASRMILTLALAVAALAPASCRLLPITSAHKLSTDDAIDDLAIKSEIESDLIDADSDLFRSVNSTVIEGRVYLTGNVEHAEDRITANRIVWSIPGVHEVHNDLKVAEERDSSRMASDFWITTKLRARILGDGGILDINFTIETIDGVVYIMGIAEDELERRQVLNHAKEVDGVVKVVDYIVLKDDRRRQSGEQGGAQGGE